MAFVGYVGLALEVPAPSAPAACMDTLEQVRRIAREDYMEIYFNETSKIVSFCPEYDSDDNAVRINVYWTTGTVGTCLDHPRQGKTQLFRRNVDLSTLRLLFQNPRYHTGSDITEQDPLSLIREKLKMKRLPP